MSFFSNAKMDASTAKFLGDNLLGASLGRAKKARNSDGLKAGRQRRAALNAMEKKLASLPPGSLERGQLFDKIQEARQDFEIACLSNQEGKSKSTREEANSLRARAKALV